MSLRRFFRLLTDRKWVPPSSVDDSLARTAKDAVHVRGHGIFGSVGGFSSTSRVYEHIAEGHENYAKSFKEGKD